MQAFERTSLQGNKGLGANHNNCEKNQQNYDQFIENNKTVYQNDCVFSKYDYYFQKAIFACKVKKIFVFY